MKPDAAAARARLTFLVENAKVERELDWCAADSFRPRACLRFWELGVSKGKAGRPDDFGKMLKLQEAECWATRSSHATCATAGLPSEYAHRVVARYAGLNGAPDVPVNSQPASCPPSV